METVVVDGVLEKLAASTRGETYVKMRGTFSCSDTCDHWNALPSPWKKPPCLRAHHGPPQSPLHYLKRSHQTRAPWAHPLASPLLADTTFWQDSASLSLVMGVVNMHADKHGALNLQSLLQRGQELIGRLDLEACVRRGPRLAASALMNASAIA